MQRNLIAAFVILLVAGTVAILLWSSSGDGAPQGTPPAIDNPASMPAHAAPTRPAPTAPMQGEQPAAREELRSEQQADPASFEQGIRGTVVDERGAPVGAASVYLVPSIGQDIFAMLAAKQRGVIHPPLAHVKTDAYGRFALGIAKAGEPPVTELRVVAESRAESRLPNLRIAAREWYDAGQIKLSKGAVVAGYVTRAGAKTPIAGAEVVVHPQARQFEYAFVPGREKGLVGRTDATGHYSIDGAPLEVVTISVVATGSARDERTGMMLVPDTENRYDFELAEGREITGSVGDASGAPIAWAAVTAVAISAKMPLVVETHSGRDGRFELQGLVEGPYQINVVQDGFARGEVKPIDAGSKDVLIRLDRLGSVQLQVYGKQGRLLTDYLVTVKTQQPGQEIYANTQIPPKQVRTRAGGVATIEGLDTTPFNYVLQVEASGHARAFSDPFRIEPGKEPQLLTVRMDEGGVLAGLVRGRDGAPLANAIVATSAGELEDSPLGKILGNVMPSNTTKGSVTTGADGQFKLTLLNPGKYMLKVTHAEHFDVLVRDIEVRSGETQQVPDVRMQSGTLVVGLVRVDGSPAGQVKVTVTGASDPTSPGRIPFYAEAITGGDGRFAIARRVPPGRYEIRASRETEGNAFGRILEYAKTKQEFVLDGQSQYLAEIQIATK